MVKLTRRMDAPGHRAGSAPEIQRAAQLRQAVRTFAAESDQIVRRHELTPRWYELLLAIAASAPSEATVTHLAKKLLIGQSATTQLVRRAENEGLLVREFSDDDARVHHVRLSDEGTRRLEAAVADLGHERAQLLEILDSLASIGGGASSGARR